MLLLWPALESSAPNWVNVRKRLTNSAHWHGSHTVVAVLDKLVAQGGAVDVGAPALAEGGAALLAPLAPLAPGGASSDDQHEVTGAHIINIQCRRCLRL